MVSEFILAELMIWASMIALLPMAVAAGIVLVKFQARSGAGAWVFSPRRRRRGQRASRPLKPTPGVPARRAA